MSEEYTPVGTVRRRPRPGHQRSQSSTSNGEAKSNGNGNGAYARNGKEARRDFESDSNFENTSKEQFREPRRPKERFEGAKQERRKPSRYGPELDDEPL